MTPPTWGAIGTGATGTTGAVSIPDPLGIVAGDLDVLIATTITGATIAITTAGGSAWTAITDADTVGGERIYGWYRIFQSGDSAPSITPSADHSVGQRFNIMAGTFDPTTPIEAINDGFEPGVDSSFAFATGVSTTVDDCLCCVACSSGQDTTTGQGSTTQNNANLTDRVLRMNLETTNGGGGGFFLATGELLAAGAVGTWSSTVTAISAKAYLCFSVRPLPPDPTLIQCVQRNGAYTASATSGTCPAWRKPTVAGNLLIIVANEFDANVGTWSTPPTGYTAIPPSPSIYNSTLSNPFGIFWKIAAGGDATPGNVGADTAASPWMIHTYEFSAPDGWETSAFDVEAHSAATATTATTKASGSTGTLDRARELAIALGALTLASANLVFSNGYLIEKPTASTPGGSAGSDTTWFGWKQTNSTTAENTTATWATSRVPGVRVATFKAKPPAPSTARARSTVVHRVGSGA